MDIKEYLGVDIEGFLNMDIKEYFLEGGVTMGGGGV